MLEGCSQSQGEQIIELEHNPNAKGLIHLEGLYPLIKEGREILVNYKPFTWKEEVEYIIQPFLIKEYNNRWFLLGWKPDEKKYTVLGLDRIQQFKETGNGILKSKQMELALLLRNIIGVSFTKGVEPLEVKLWVSKAQLPYFTTKPMHPTQKLIEEQQEGSVFSFQLIPNFELEQKILMLGERVKVIAPNNLASRIQERLRAAIKNYEI